MDASPRIQESSAKPSSISYILRTPCGREDAPMGPDSNESALKLLERATAAGDTHATSQVLQFLRKQYSQENRKNWPPDTVRRLWRHAIQALRDSTVAEVAARACQLIEVLAQNCKSCMESRWEVVLDEEAPKQVIQAMEKYSADLSVHSSALRALLSMSGCMTCRSFYDEETQDAMRRANAVAALVKALNLLQQLTTKMQFETNAHKVARLAIADAVQTLHYICLMNRESTAQLASLNGLKSIKTSIEDDLNELTVQEHGCMLLAEIAISASVSDQEVLECVETITMVARLQMQEKFLEVARAAVWSLARIASATLHPWSHRPGDAPRSSSLDQAWLLMQDQVLNMIMGMMQSCQLKNDPLVKHCLDFIAVVGSDDGLLEQHTVKILENFEKAGAVVYDLLVETEDLRIKAVALRTLCAIMTNPQGGQTRKESAPMTLEALFHAMHGARNCVETSEKDIFCIQVFGLAMIAHVDSLKVFVKSSQTSQYTKDVHEAVGYILRYIEESGEEFFFESSDSKEAVIEVSCCRNACHCCFIHESCTIHDVLRAVTAVARFLLICDDDGVNTVDIAGQTILHKLSQLGLKECLRVFLDVCGDEVDYLMRTSDGATALQLARASRDPSCAALLEKKTEVASEKAQDALLKELNHEHEKTMRNPSQAKKKGKKKTTGTFSEAEPAGPPTHENSDELSESHRTSAEKRKEIEETERKRAEEEYERALAERRKQLEDMNVSSSMMKAPCDRAHHCDEKRSNAVKIRETSPHDFAKTTATSTTAAAAAAEQSPMIAPRFRSKEDDVVVRHAWGEGNRAIGLTSTCEARKQHHYHQPQLALLSSISVSSGTNNGSPDPTPAPSACFDDRIVDANLSAFQSGEQRAAFGHSQGDDKTTSNWHSLFSNDLSDMTTVGPDMKWAMMSSSSGQNNHISSESDRQSSFVQQNSWYTSFSNLTRKPQENQLQQPEPPSPELMAATDLIGQPAKKAIVEEDGVDDTQILSWLSTEITGLIGNGSPTDETATDLHNPRDFRCDLAPSPPPPPPPQRIPSFDCPDEVGGYMTMSPSMSPFYSGNPVGGAPYKHPGATGGLAQSHSTPWGNVTAPTVTMDPRLIPQSELNNGDARPGVHPSRFWHTEENDIPSKHLWLGNLNTRLPRSVLKSVFEEYGPIEDVVTFPGRMYAFVNFIHPEDAQRAAKELDNRSLPVLTGNRRLVIKFRPNRKALGRVGDLMPGVANIEDHSGAGATAGGGAIAASISVPVFRSPEMSSPQQSGAENIAVHHPGYIDEEQPTENLPVPERDYAFQSVASAAPPMGSPCRHLWLGNVCVRPSKTVLFSLFSRYGPVESVRVFPGKTYAFVNFHAGEHAHKAKEALDGKVLTAITGTKALVVRFQREGSGPVGWNRPHDNLSTIPPLQSTESAPVAYVANSALMTHDRLGMAVPSAEYRTSSNETHRTPSLSPDEYPPLIRSRRGPPEVMYYDFYASERQQKLSSPEQIAWMDGASKEMTGPEFGVNAGAGLQTETLGVFQSSNSSGNNTALEASSIGHLTRTLSAAATGKGQRPSPYTRASTIDRTIPWNPASLSGATPFEDQGGLQSSYTGPLNSSQSFNGYDAKGYSGAFFHSQTAAGPGGLDTSQSWVSPPSSVHRFRDSVTTPNNHTTTSSSNNNLAFDQCTMLPSVSVSHAAIKSHESGGGGMGSEMSALPQQSLPPELFIANGGSALTDTVSANVDLSQAQPYDFTGFASSAVISCDKDSIW